MSGTVQLVLYGRPECPLCQDMLAVLKDLQQHFAFELLVIDVDDTEDLREQYGLRVPVLTGNGREICHFFLDMPALRAFFDTQEAAKSE